MHDFVSVNNTSELREIVQICKVICIHNYNGEVRVANRVICNAEKRFNNEEKINSCLCDSIALVH